MICRQSSQRRRWISSQAYKGTASTRNLTARSIETCCCLICIDAQGTEVFPVRVGKTTGPRAPTDQALVISRKQRTGIGNVRSQAKAFEHLMRCADGGGNNGKAALLFDDRNRG